MRAGERAVRERIQAELMVRISATGTEEGVFKGGDGSVQVVAEESRRHGTGSWLAGSRSTLSVLYSSRALR
jgi:hypothetical protein